MRLKPPKNTNRGRRLAPVPRPERLRPDWRTAIDRRPVQNQWLVAREMAYAEHLGGREEMSVAQEALVERLVHFEAQIGVMEADIRDGQSIDVMRYTALVDRLHSLLKTIGIRRTARRVSLADILAQQNPPPPPARSAVPVQHEADPPAGGGDPE